MREWEGMSQYVQLHLVARTRVEGKLQYKEATRSQQESTYSENTG